MCGHCARVSIALFSHINVWSLCQSIYALLSHINVWSLCQSINLFVHYLTVALNLSYQHGDIIDGLDGVKSKINLTIKHSDILIIGTKQSPEDGSVNVWC